MGAHILFMQYLLSSCLHCRIVHVCYCRQIYLFINCIWAFAVMALRSRCLCIRFCLECAAVCMSKNICMRCRCRLSAPCLCRASICALTWYASGVLSEARQAHLRSASIRPACQPWGISLFTHDAPQWATPIISSWCTSRIAEEKNTTSPVPFALFHVTLVQLTWPSELVSLLVLAVCW